MWENWKCQRVGLLKSLQQPDNNVDMISMNSYNRNGIDYDVLVKFPVRCVRNTCSPFQKEFLKRFQFHSMVLQIECTHESIQCTLHVFIMFVGKLQHA